MLSNGLFNMRLYMNVYDFDKTIYNGDSTVDFYFFCLRKYPNIIKFLPALFYYAVFFALGFYDKTRFKEKFYIFLSEIKNIDEAVLEFWAKYEYKIKDFYKENKKDDDIIISASSEFLLEPICDK
jgi:phosphoserine phosphatase